jgi:predicted PurR-regulated permease PerM
MESKGLKTAYGYLGPLLLMGGFLAAWAILRRSQPLSHVFFLGLFSLVLAAMLDLGVSFLERWMPRWAGTLLSVLLALGLVAGVAALAAPAMARQGGQIVEKAALGLETLKDLGQRLSDGPLGNSLGGDPSDLAGKLKEKLGAMAGKAVPAVFGTATALLEIFALGVLAVFWVLRPREYVSALVSLFPKDKEKRVLGVMAAMGEALRGWSVGTLVSMSIIGVLTGIGLLLLGVEGWLTLAAIAFFGEFIPLAGPILAAIPALAVALSQSPQTALWVALLYLATQQLEGNVVQPLVMRRAVDIRPPVLILWQMLFAMGFGFLGLLVATPLLAVLQAALRKGYVEDTLGRPAREE